MTNQPTGGEGVTDADVEPREVVKPAGGYRRAGIDEIRPEPFIENELDDDGSTAGSGKW